MKSLLDITRKSDITFRRNGNIDISSRVVKWLSIQPGDVVDVMADRGDYYFYVKHRNPVGRHEASVYKTCIGSKHYRAQSKRLCSAMMQVCGSDVIARLCVGEPMESPHGLLVPIITRFTIP